MSQNDLSALQRTQTQLNEKNTLNKQAPVIDPVNIAIQQLELKVTDQQDKKQIKKILQILQYPITQVAQIHVAANRLGNRDQQVPQLANIKKSGSGTSRKQQLAKSAIYCPCCSMVKQQYELKLCQPLDDISNLGLSTFLYFQSIKNLAIILIEMLLIYGIFAFATNIVASGKLTTCNGLTKCTSNLDYLAISLGSKQQNPTTQNQTYYYVQCWLGVAMVIIWFITFSLLKYLQKKKELQVDIQTRSASDFTLLVQGLPDQITKQQFESQLKVYESKIQKMNVAAYKKKPFNITRFNKGKPFFIKQKDLKDQEIQKLQNQMKQMKQQLAQWIIQRQESQAFSQTKQQKQQFFKKYQANIEAQKKRITQLSQQMKKKMNQQKSDQNPVFFITLDSNIAKNTIVQLNPRQFSSRVRNFLTCNSGGNKFDFSYQEKNFDLKIQRAPQPQDIIWPNIGLTDGQKLCRKIITFTVTMIILGLSFLAVYGLSVAQIKNTDNRFISILISLVISLINIGIAQSIKYLSIFERDYTTIKYQTSLAIKSIMASLVNSILVPIIANRFIKDNNLYQKNGLADDIFMLGLTNAFVTPILKYFDGGYFFSKIMKWHKLKPKSKLYMSQLQLNTYLTNMDFQIGYQYVYVVHLYLFVCFFVSLQPIICAFAIIGYLLMFWSQKWALFNRMRRPIPGNDLINTAMNQLIFLGPIIYSLGSLTWSNFFPDGTPKYALLPNLIAIGISGLMFIFPLQFIYTCCLGDKQQPQIKYQESRIYLPSEYDRLNPATAEQGLKDYMKYIQNKLKGGSKQQQAKFADIFRNVQQKSHRPNAMQQLPLAPQGMMNFFNPAPQPFMMQSPYFSSVMQPPMMMMPMMNPIVNPMMGYGSPLMMPMYQPPLQNFNSLNSGFGIPQQPYTQPVQTYQPIQQQRPPIQQPPTFIPPQQNVIGFGQPQNQYPPIGFQGNQQGQGFGQPGYNQTPGFGQAQGFNNQAQRFNQGPPGYGQPFNPFSM